MQSMVASDQAIELYGIDCLSRKKPCMKDKNQCVIKSVSRIIAIQIVPPISQ